MQEAKIEMIGKSLEQERDYFLHLQTDNIFLRILQKQINIFYTNYFLTFTDSSKNNNEINIVDLYRDYYSTKFNATRFLLELFLTSLKLISQPDIQKKEYISFSMGASERINEHLLDLWILEFDKNKTEYTEKVNKNISEFPRFLSKFKPSHINVNGNLSKLCSEVKINRKNIGFEYYPYNIPRYVPIIEEIQENNGLLDPLILKLQKTGYLHSNIDTGFIRKLYSILSNTSHPTIQALQEFEIFIGTKDYEEKKAILKQQQKQNDEWLKVIGMLMDGLFKNERNFDFKDINYN